MAHLLVVEWKIKEMLSMAADPLPGHVQRCRCGVWPLKVVAESRTAGLARDNEQRLAVTAQAAVEP
jgi:hypothetical protein